jgi:hypothetical protein
MFIHPNMLAGTFRAWATGNTGTRPGSHTDNDKTNDARVDHERA